MGMVEIVKRAEARYMAAYSPHEIKILHITQVVFSLVSFLTGIVGMTFFLRMDPRRRMIFRLQLFFGLIFWDFIKALCYIIIGSVRLTQIPELIDPFTEIDPKFCDGMGFMISVCGAVSDCIMLMLTVHNALMIFYPNLSKTHKRRVVRYSVIFKNIKEVLMLKRTPAPKNLLFDETTKFICITEGGLFRARWILSAMLFSYAFTAAGVVFVGGNHYLSDWSCTPRTYPIWIRLVNDWVLKFINLLSILIIYSSIILYLLYQFRKLAKAREKIYQSSRDFNRSFNIQHNNEAGVNLNDDLQKELMQIASDANENSNEKRLKIAMKETKTFIVYPIGYFSIWITPAVSQIFFVWRHQTNGFGLRLMRTMTLPLACFIDTMIFLIREKPWNSTTAKINQNGTAFFRDDEGYLETEAPKECISTDDSKEDEASRDLTRRDHNNFHLDESSSISMNDSDDDNRISGYLPQSWKQGQEPESTLSSSQTGKTSSRIPAGENSSRRTSRTSRSTREHQRPENLFYRNTTRSSNEAENEDEEDDMDFIEFLRKGPGNG